MKFIQLDHYIFLCSRLYHLGLPLERFRPVTGTKEKTKAVMKCIRPVPTMNPHDEPSRMPKNIRRFKLIK